MQTCMKKNENERSGSEKAAEQQRCRVLLASPMAFFSVDAPARVSQHTAIVTGGWARGTAAQRDSHALPLTTFCCIRV